MYFERCACNCLRKKTRRNARHLGKQLCIFLENTCSLSAGKYFGSILGVHKNLFCIDESVLVSHVS